MPDLSRSVTRGSVDFRDAIEEMEGSVASGSSLGPPIKAPPKHGNIRITVICAQELAKRDKYMLPDVFATISYRKVKKHTTETIKKTLSPEWEQHFELRDVQEGSVFSVQLFNERRLPAMLDPDCFLGESLIPIRLEHSYSQNARLLRSPSFLESDIPEGTIYITTEPLKEPSRPNSLESDRAQPRAGVRPQSREEPRAVVIDVHNPALFDHHLPLPDGWELRITSTGRPYWVDNVRGWTTWTHPALPEAIMSAQLAPAYVFDDVDVDGFEV